MRPDRFRTLTRRLAAAGSAAPDAELLGRFVRDRDDPSFAALVDRHGPMVWGVCRALLPDEADADDAFQATFLTLSQRAAQVRNPASVAAWLHGTAVRVAGRIRRAAARRRKRERAAAAPEAGPGPVADSRWAATLVAVHDEVRHLPADLRAAVVLCDLGGASRADAAARLGWNPGTLASRLARARERLLGRLARRGIAPAAAGLGVLCAPAPAPARLVDAARTFPTATGTVPAAVTHLSRGVTDMSRLKLIAAAVLVAGGLTAGVSARLASRAGAQDPAAGKPPLTRGERAELGDAVQLLGAFVNSGISGSPAWEFKYYAPAGAVSPAAIEQAAARYALRGWAFAGTATFPAPSAADRTRIEFADAGAGKRPGGGPVDVLVFRRRPPVGEAPEAYRNLPQQHDRVSDAGSTLLSGLAALSHDQQHHGAGGALQGGTLQQHHGAGGALQGGTLLSGQAVLSQADQRVQPPAAGPDEAAALTAQITALQARLAAIRAGGKKAVTLPAAEVGSNPTELKDAVDKLAALRFGSAARTRLELRSSAEGLTLVGDAEAVDWAAGVARTLKRLATTPATPAGLER